MRRSIYLKSILISYMVFACGNTDPEKETGKFSFHEVSNLVNLNFLHEPGVDSSYYMPESIGSGCAFLDYDNDGDLDIYMVNGNQHNAKNLTDTLTTNRLFRQNADGKFSDVTESSGLGNSGYGMGVAVGDINNDGYVDVYITNYGYDALYRNNGDGTFTDITQIAGINNPLWGCSALFFDYNLDGFLDLYVTNYVDYDPEHVCVDEGGRRDYCGPGGFPGVPDVLYRNNGDGTFSDVSIVSNIAKSASKGLGVVSADFNGDQYPDIYVANDGEANHLWINQQDGTFQDQALLFGAALNELGRPEAGMGIALGDIDNDNDTDLFVTHLRHESNTLYRFTGEYGIQDDSRAAGLAGTSIPFTNFGTGFSDFDNDGDLDIAIVSGRVTRGSLLTAQSSPGYWDHYAEPNFLFENDGTGTFIPLGQDASAFSRIIENSRGLAFGDLDNDGDIDLLVANEGGPARLFLNDTSDKGNWLIIRAINPEFKRDAIGAKVTIKVSGNRLSRLISPGYSFLSSNDPRAHFGLGNATSVEEISITWPDGSLEIFPGIDANQIVTIKKKNPKFTKTKI